MWYQHPDKQIWDINQWIENLSLYPVIPNIQIIKVWIFKVWMLKGNWALDNICLDEQGSIAHFPFRQKQYFYLQMHRLILQTCCLYFSSRWTSCFYKMSTTCDAPSSKYIHNGRSFILSFDWLVFIVIRRQSLVIVRNVTGVGVCTAVIHWQYYTQQVHCVSLSEEWTIMKYLDHEIHWPGL